jgi:uncharacterized protein involved in exopolysaccharide biosynthesis
MAKALALAIAAMIATVLNRLSGDKLKAWMPWFTDELLRIAIRRLPDAGRERFSEEWASHLDEVSGQISKVLVALGCVSAGRQMALSLKSAEPVRKHSLGTSIVLLRVRAGLLSRSLMDSAMTLFLNMVGVSDESSKRNWTTIILIPTLLTAVVGFLTSFAFTTKWTSHALILVEGQKVPESMVQPVVSEDLAARMATLQQQVMSQTNLQPVVGRVLPGKNSEEVSEIIDEIRLNMTVEPVVTDLSEASGKEKGGQSTAVPGFYVNFTASKPQEAQQICNELTNLLVNENLKSIQAAASGTSAVLSKGLEDARRQLEDLGSKLASLKKSPHESVSATEAQQRLLTIDYDSAQKNYEELLAKKSAADLTITMTNLSEGERMFVLNPADLPDSSDFPNRLLFAVVGGGTGLALGIILVLWRKFRRATS